MPGKRTMAETDAWLLSVLSCVEAIQAYAEEHAAGFDYKIFLACDGWRSMGLPFAAAEDSMIFEVYDTPARFHDELLNPFAQECIQKFNVYIHRLHLRAQVSATQGAILNPDFDYEFAKKAIQPKWRWVSVLSIALPQVDLEMLSSLLNVANNNPTGQRVWNNRFHSGAGKRELNIDYLKGLMVHVRHVPQYANPGENLLTSVETHVWKKIGDELFPLSEDSDV